MISAEQVASIEGIVVWLGLAIGLMLGWVAQYARFCTLGAIADWYAMGDTSRLRMWLLAIATAILGSQALILAGLIDVSGSFYVAPRVFWLSNVLGGLVFGFGMALASGCGSRTLIRIGGGSLKALVVFLIMAIFAYITMRGLLGVLRVSTVETIFIELASKQDLPSIAANQIGSPVEVTRAFMAAIATFALVAFIFLNQEFRRQPRLAMGGIVVGLMVVAGWFVTGYLGFIEEDPTTLEARFLATNTRGIESLTFVAPLAYWLELFMLWSDTTKVVTFSIATVSGVVIGSLIHSVASGQFKWEGFQSRGDLSNHMVGAALMGAGGVVAFGCTIGQGISGLSMLALGSGISTLAILAGTWLGLAWLERQA
jgi:uncharacterized protein